MKNTELEYKKFRRDLKSELYNIKSKTRNRTLAYYDETYAIEKNNFFKVVKQTPKQIATEIIREEGQNNITKTSSMMGRAFLYLWSGIYFDVLVGGILFAFALAFGILAPISGLAFSVTSIVDGGEAGLIASRIIFGLTMTLPIMYIFSAITFGFIYISRIVWTWTIRFFWNQNPDLRKYLPIEKYKFLLNKKLLTALVVSVVLAGIIVGVLFGVYGSEAFSMTF